MIYQKHVKTEITYTFTGFAFAKACDDAGIKSGYQMGKLMQGYMYPAKFKRWKAKDEKLIAVEEFTMKLILGALEKALAAGDDKLKL